MNGLVRGVNQQTVPLKNSKEHEIRRTSKPLHDQSRLHVFGGINILWVHGWFDVSVTWMSNRSIDKVSMGGGGHI